MLKAKKEDIFTIPNILTYIRLLLVPVFAIVFFLGGAYRIYIALAIFAVAEITDIVDGKIARKYNLITDIGKVFDPLADKLLQVTAIVCLAFQGYLPWVFAIILFAKEFYMIIGSVILAKMNCVGQANRWGKLAATILGYSMIACFFHNHFMMVAPWFYLDWAAVGVGLVVTIYAAYDYTAKAVIQIKNRNTAAAADEDKKFELDYNASLKDLEHKHIEAVSYEKKPQESTVSEEHDELDD